MSNKLSSSAEKVQEALKAFGLSCQIVEMQETTRTAQDAADALGCDVAQIVKSLVFKGKKTQKLFLVLASGANRVNTKTLREVVSEPVQMAAADVVLATTGFAVGGVPPLGHTQKLKAFIDEDLLKHKEIWAAAGTPNAMFKLASSDLAKITGGHVISVTS
ncbi:MAG: YbaK/EbsC family protein [Pseudomonadota bacterium]